MDHFAGYSPSTTLATILQPLLPPCHLYSSFLLGLTNGGPSQRWDAVSPMSPCFTAVSENSYVPIQHWLLSSGPFSMITGPTAPTICYSCPFGPGMAMASLCRQSWILDRPLFVPVTLPTGAAVVPSSNSLHSNTQRSILFPAKIPMQSLCKINIEVPASWLRTVREDSKHNRPMSMGNMHEHSKPPPSFLFWQTTNYM